MIPQIECNLMCNYSIEYFLSFEKLYFFIYIQVGGLPVKMIMSVWLVQTKKEDGTRKKITETVNIDVKKR